MTRDEDEQAPKPRNRRPRAPRIKTLPESMRDPRHNPDAALAEIRAVLKAGGRPLSLDEAKAWLGQVDLQHFEAEIDPQTGEARSPEKAERDKDGRLRFRKPGEKHGPGRLRMRSEQAIEQAEADFARAVNQVEQVSCLLDHQSVASRRAVAVRSSEAEATTAKVCELYDSMTLPALSRASAIVRLLAREGRTISVQRVRQILRAHGRSAARGSNPS
ncbi:MULTISPECIES: hypothetical protein [unclassified Acidiphilium]|uniref:hypothetical protein n=1 Tax=unclassified Acidiphilium TaxID=2617493 RepID=UPI000BD13AEF|nr:MULTISPECIES: hypothetical protein [unclassified Acidiphilium]OYV56629.1 MAG: hypothetical protein B7Z76_05430 [Acidiphilium sp. 20-67-58]OYV67632.1 MAG: hypothetical protein B7X09_00825 [Acidiphilium sp. 21-66-27]HQT62688.1 hypothetical protein [Acidiphilium sp.]